MKAGITLLIAYSCLISAFANESNVMAAWVQYSAKGVEARIVARTSCPAINVNGRDMKMIMRASPTKNHPNIVCAAVISEVAKSVKINEMSLPIPQNSELKRIVVVGDTGCRLSDRHGLYQECNINSLWPFVHVAESINDAKPDLIIHMGDYVYRESPCPKGNSGCTGSPYGDTQKTWEAELLHPTKKIHLAAPLLLVRGNHENCERAGFGWFRYFDAHEFTSKCEESTDPWIVNLPGMQIAVMDTAYVKNKKGASLGSLFADQLAVVNPKLHQNTWLVTHRPFWGYGADDDSGKLVMLTKALQSAVAVAGLSDMIKLIVAGHIHLAELLAFKGAFPPQLISGNGGTQLVASVQAPKQIDDIEIETQRVINQYGFAVMESFVEKQNVWTISFRDVAGRELERCTLNNSGVTCD